MSSLKATASRTFLFEDTTHHQVLPLHVQFQSHKHLALCARQHFASVAGVLLGAAQQIYPTLVATTVPHSIHRPPQFDVHLSIAMNVANGMGLKQQTEQQQQQQGDIERDILGWQPLRCDAVIPSSDCIMATLQIGPTHSIKVGFVSLSIWKYHLHTHFQHIFLKLKEYASWYHADLHIDDMETEIIPVRTRHLTPDLEMMIYNDHS